MRTGGTRSLQGSHGRLPVALRASGIRKRFGALEVLRSADLEVLKNEALAIVGPSGSGKSSLMAIFGLLTGRDDGELELLGQEIPLHRPSRKAIASVRLRLAWIPQHPIMLPGRTVLDNALVGVRCRRSIQADDLNYALDLLTMLEISHLAGRNASVLSGGELQKLSLVRALAARPDLILADEPSASLDRTSTELVVRALAIAAPFCTMVVASHDSRIADACHRVVSVRDGRLEGQS